MYLNFIGVMTGEETQHPLLSSEDRWSSATSHIILLQVSPQTCGFSFSTFFSHTIVYPPRGRKKYIKNTHTYMQGLWYCF